MDLVTKMHLLLGEVLGRQSLLISRGPVQFFCLPSVPLQSAAAANSRSRDCSGALSLARRRRPGCLRHQYFGLNKLETLQSREVDIINGIKTLEQAIGQRQRTQLARGMFLD